MPGVRSPPPLELHAILSPPYSFLHHFKSNVCARARERERDGYRERWRELGERRWWCAAITVFDLDTAKGLLRVPGCAAAAHGPLFFSDHSLVASQVAKHGFVGSGSGSGSIITWPINKLRSSRRSHTMEAIEPLCSTRDGAYLAAGDVSGNVHLWEVASGRLLKSWTAHRKSVKCMSFSDDGSFLISGSDGGMIPICSMIRLLDIDDCGSFSALLHCSSEHSSSITGLLTITTSTRLKFVSNSMDGSCKDSFLHERDRTVVLKGHNDSITALTFWKTGLISASNDCTVCIWDIESCKNIRRFFHQKDNGRGFDRRSQQESSATAMENKVETPVDRRRWAINMAKHVVEMNRQIQLCLLEMMKLRLWTEEFQTSSVTNQRKKMKKTKKKSL
ncbi:PREDICTED: protein ROOT INITIATION DEFECTIVE 3-like isoform X2 [Tarenaya hassleriana]|uniref:protein ROOT INITIATION DEFECTIVE 3-like isoform X2 n=1 Tax=Tarenaya hassleriana TaxID=28532 RepID=UPI00053C40EA|nr:PREDICTED: protein ROOT INITIATION DEFECTIVE 3-like isoform X2 [Tarenaya hassleriana]